MACGYPRRLLPTGPGAAKGGMNLSARGAQQKQQQAAREGGRRGERVTAGGLREAAHVG